MYIVSCHQHSIRRNWHHLYEQFIHFTHCKLNLKSTPGIEAIPQHCTHHMFKVGRHMEKQGLSWNAGELAVWTTQYSGQALLNRQCHKANFSRMNASEKDVLKSEAYFLSISAVRRITDWQNHLTGAWVFGLLLRPGFVTGLCEASTQILITADSYWRYWCLELVKFKAERIYLRVKRLKMWKLPRSQGAPCGPKNKIQFFMIITPGFSTKEPYSC